MQCYDCGEYRHRKQPLAPLQGVAYALRLHDKQGLQCYVLQSKHQNIYEAFPESCLRLS